VESEPEQSPEPGFEIGHRAEHFSIGGAAPAREPEQSEPNLQAQAPAVEPEPAEPPEAAVEGGGALEGEAVSEIIAESREGGAFSPEDVVDSPQPALETIPADLVHESTGPETALPE